jgi:DNA-binding Lrp family transcriptional regulator
MINSMATDEIDQGRSLSLDRVDARILLALGGDVRISVTELAARLSLSRNTVQAHLLRLERHGLLRFASLYDQVAAAGLTMTAFVTLDINQHDYAETAQALGAIPEILEAHAIAGGDGDLWCRIVARDADHLGRVLDHVAVCPGVQRTRTSLAIGTPVACRADSVLGQLAGG